VDTRTIQEVAGVALAASGLTLTGVAVAARRTMRHLRDIKTVIMGEPARVAAGVMLPAVPSLGARVQEAVDVTASTREAVRGLEVQAQTTLTLLREHERQPAGMAHGMGVG